MNLDYVTLRFKSGHEGASLTSEDDGAVLQPEIRPTQLPLMKGIARLYRDYDGDMTLGYNLTGTVCGASSPHWENEQPKCVAKRTRRASENFPTRDDLHRYVAILNDTLMLPNIVQTERIIFDDEQDVVVNIMEKMDGCLEEPDFAPGRKGQLAPSLSARVLLVIAQDILGALEHLAEKGIVHGDVRPKNILYQKTEGPAEDWTYKLSGFDYSVKLTGTGEAESTRSTLCSYPYASPELLREDSYSLAGDIWSLGVTLHVLRYGRFPFPPWEVEFQIVQSIVGGELELSAPATDDPDEATLHGIIVKMLTLDPAQRFKPTDCLKKAESEGVSSERTGSQGTTSSGSSPTGGYIEYSGRPAGPGLAECRLGSKSAGSQELSEGIYTDSSKE